MDMGTPAAACSKAGSTGDNGPLHGPAAATVWEPADVLDTLGRTPGVDAIILDPWYNKGIGGVRPDYHEWLASLISAALCKAPHVFVWGFPEILALQVAHIPEGARLVEWLTWFYKNCPSRIRGWRSAQNACLHLAVDGALLYPEHFLNERQLERMNQGTLRFIPGPPSVLEAALNIGFVRRHEQTGHPAQKPLSVIEPLIKMSTVPGGTVLDPMCGSGTTGEACLRLGRRAILCDHDAEYVNMTRVRLTNWEAANRK